MSDERTEDGGPAVLETRKRRARRTKIVKSARSPVANLTHWRELQESYLAEGGWALLWMFDCTRVNGRVERTRVDDRDLIEIKEESEQKRNAAIERIASSPGCVLIASIDDIPAYIASGVEPVHLGDWNPEIGTTAPVSQPDFLTTVTFDVKA